MTGYSLRMVCISLRDASAIISSHLCLTSIYNNFIILTREFLNESFYQQYDWFSSVIYIPAVPYL